MKSGFEPFGITKSCNENRRIREEMFSGFYTHQKMTDSPQLILYKVNSIITKKLNKDFFLLAGWRRKNDQIWAKHYHRWAALSLA